MGNSDHLVEMSSFNAEEARQITTGGIVRSAEGDASEWNVVYVSTGVFQGVSTWATDPIIHELRIFDQGSGRYLEFGFDTMASVYSGGTISASRLFWRGGIQVGSGGTAYDIDIDLSCAMWIIGGYASRITAHAPLTYIDIVDSGVIDNMTLRGGSVAYVNTGGSAYGNTMSASLLNVGSGGFASNNLLVSGGWLSVYDDGSAFSNRAYSDCIVHVHGGYISATNIYFSGTLNMYYGGIASDTTVTQNIGVRQFSSLQVSYSGKKTEWNLISEKSQKIRLLHGMGNPSLGIFASFVSTTRQNRNFFQKN